jgi:hypothetical protein
MTRSLHLAILALLMGAGVVLAAPVVNRQANLPLQAAKPVRAPSHSDFVFHVDSKSGCVWRVSTVDGSRNGDRLPCAKSRRKANDVAERN